MAYTPKKQAGSYLLHASGKIEERRLRVAEAYFRDGIAAQDIAEKEGVGIATVYNDIAAMRAEWYESRLARVADWHSQQLAKLDFIEEQAQEAWFRSIGRTVKSQKKRNANGDLIEQYDTEEDMVGDPRFLVQLQNVIDRRAKLLGLDAPQTLVIDTMESRLVTLIKEGRVTFDMLAKDQGVQVATKFFNLAGKQIPVLIEGEIIEEDE